MTTSAVDHSGPGAVPDWTLGWRISRALDFGGVTNKQLAEEFELNPATISRWIGDKGAAPKAIYLRQIALRCGVSYDWLATGHAPANGPDGAPDGPESGHMRRYLDADLPGARVIPLNRTATHRNNRDDVVRAG